MLGTTTTTTSTAATTTTTTTTTTAKGTKRPRSTKAGTQASKRGGGWRRQRDVGRTRRGGVVIGNGQPKKKKRSKREKGEGEGGETESKRLQERGNLRKQPKSKLEKLMLEHLKKETGDGSNIENAKDEKARSNDENHNGNVKKSDQLPCRKKESTSPNGGRGGRGGAPLEEEDFDDAIPTLPLDDDDLDTWERFDVASAVRGRRCGLSRQAHTMRIN